MGGSCSRYGGEKRYKQGFGGKHDDTTWKTQV